MAQPLLRLRQGSTTASVADHWRIIWDVVNGGSEPLAVTSIWLPHGRFRSEERQLVPPVTMPPETGVQLGADVRFAEEPGTVVENGFFILMVRAGEESWQVYARLRITAGSQGQPRAEVELITVQREGSLDGPTSD